MKRTIGPLLSCGQLRPFNKGKDLWAAIRLLISIPALLIFAASLAGCRKADEEVLSVKLGKETRYYNDYLGISYTIPRGWWLYDLSEDNLSESRGDIYDYVSMDIDYGEYEGYDYSSIWLMNFGNLESSTRTNHLGFGLDARSLEGINDMAGFMKYFEIFMLEPTEEEEYTMLESGLISINGKVFELRDYLVSRYEDDFNMMTLSCEAKNGYFFNIIVDYWPGNTKAKQAIIDSVSKAIDFY